MALILQFGELLAQKAPNNSSVQGSFHTWSLCTKQQPAIMLDM